jgi:hypothetical protein
MIDRHYGHLVATNASMDQAARRIQRTQSEPWTLVDARWTPTEPVGRRA